MSGSGDTGGRGRAGWGVPQCPIQEMGTCLLSCPPHGIAVRKKELKGVSRCVHVCTYVCVYVQVCVHVHVKLAMNTHGQRHLAALPSVVFRALLQAAVHVGGCCPHVSQGGQTPAAHRSGLSGLPMGGFGPRRWTEPSRASSCSVHL